MNVRYVVTFTEAERNELQALVAKGSRLARRVKKVQILLAADSGATDDEVARLLVVGTSTVYFDESPTQLIGETRVPIAAKPGIRERYDYDYRRNGRRTSSSSSTRIDPGGTRK